MVSIEKLAAFFLWMKNVCKVASETFRLIGGGELLTDSELEIKIMFSEKNNTRNEFLKAQQFSDFMDQSNAKWNNGWSSIDTSADNLRIICVAIYECYSSINQNNSIDCLINCTRDTLSMDLMFFFVVSAIRSYEKQWDLKENKKSSSVWEKYFRFRIGLKREALVKTERKVKRVQIECFVKWIDLNKMWFKGKSLNLLINHQIHRHFGHLWTINSHHIFTWNIIGRMYNWKIRISSIVHSISSSHCPYRVPFSFTFPEPEKWPSLKVSSFLILSEMPFFILP